MTAPAYPQLNRGTSFQLKRGDGASPEVFTLLATATTRDVDRALETDDAMQIDPANPDNIPVRNSVAKGITHDVSFSGKADFLRFRTLEQDMEAGVAKNYQILREGTGALGGGVLAFSAIPTGVKMTSQENGMVAFSATLKGQGLPVWTANS